MNPIVMRARNNLKKTSTIRTPNKYVRALLPPFHPLAINEERALEYKGQWREKVFNSDNNKALDLEIGIGVGYYFEHHARQNPNRNLVGLEIKYKSLYQSVERLRRADLLNARGVRYNGYFVHEIFEENELDDVIIHHPDPWSKRIQVKRRLIQDEFMESLSRLQKKGAYLYFKTDSEDYFDWALEVFRNSKYKIIGQTRDLHNSEFSEGNFVTQFEKIFINKGQPIYFAKLQNQ